MSEADSRREREYRSYSQFGEERLSLVTETGEASTRALHPGAAVRAFLILKTAFVALLLISGLDKFSGQITDWSTYLSPALPGALGISSRVFLYGVGAWEIFLGVGVALRPRVFADLTGAWFGLCFVNHIAYGQHFEIALFDLALAVCALGLGRLSQ